MTGSNDHEVELWRVGREKAVCTLGFHTNPVLSVALSPSGARLLTVSGDAIYTTNTITSVWEIDTNTTTKSPFFGLLEEAKNNESGFTPRGLAKALAECVSDVQELKIFYTLVSTAFRKNEITQSDRDLLLVEVLEQAAVTFSFDQESRVTAILRLVLKKAEADGAITPIKKGQLEEQYTKSNVFADYRFRSLEALVKHQSERLSNLEDYVKAMDRCLRTTMKRKATIGFVCSIIPIVGGALDALSGFMEVAFFDLLEGILDFSDKIHIDETVRERFSEALENGLMDWSEKPLTALLEEDHFYTKPDLLPVVAVLKMSHSICGSEALPNSTTKIEEIKEEETVKAVLEQLHLTDYEQAFDEHGIGTVKDLLELSKEDLKEMEMNIGERNKVMKWIREHS